MHPRLKPKFVLQQAHLSLSIWDRGWDRLRTKCMFVEMNGEVRERRGRVRRRGEETTEMKEPGTKPWGRNWGTGEKPQGASQGRSHLAAGLAGLELGQCAYGRANSGPTCIQNGAVFPFLAPTQPASSVLPVFRTWPGKFPGHWARRSKPAYAIA